MLHVYHGNGKGKTTAAIGLAVRASGAGKNVIFSQFMKGNVSSEILPLQKLDGIETKLVGKQFGFYKNMSEDCKQEITECHNRILGEIWEAVQEGKTNLVILDELSSAYRYGLMKKELVLQLLEEVEKRPMELEIVITGREPDTLFLEKADYITEMKMEKHPYEKGIMAREGIEW